MLTPELGAAVVRLFPLWGFSPPCNLEEADTRVLLNNFAYSEHLLLFSTLDTYTPLANSWDTSKAGSILPLTGAPASVLSQLSPPSLRSSGYFHWLLKVQL